MSESNAETQRLDQATRERLSRLSSAPVDTSRLEARLRTVLPLKDARRSWAYRWLRPIGAVAACIVLLATLSVVFLISSDQPVMASPLEMAKMHHDLVASKQVMAVASIDEANRMLAGQSSAAPSLPQVPDNHVMACCMRDVKNKKVACVLLKSRDVPVSIAVADAADMKLPRTGPGRTVERDGRVYHVQTAGMLNMVTTQRDGRWVCVMGETAPLTLVDLAEQLKF